MENPGDDATRSLVANCRREMKWMFLFWLLALVWVVGYCSLFGNANEEQPTPTILGLPAWVVWGVFVPWLLSMLFSSFFALRIMADDDLEGSNGDG